MAENRRHFIKAAGATGLAALTGRAFAQQATSQTGTPPSVITNPPRQWGHHAPPSIYPDPDIIIVDPSEKRTGNVTDDCAARETPT